MDRKCGVSWYGNRRKQIEIGEDVNKFFSKNCRNIKLEIDGKTYYAKLPDSFFSTCKHIRTAYDRVCKNKKGKNRLHEWVVKNNVKKARFDVIKTHIEFKLSKLE